MRGYVGRVGVVDEGYQGRGAGGVQDGEEGGDGVVSSVGGYAELGEPRLPALFGRVQ